MEKIENVLVQWHPLIYKLSSSNYRQLKIPFEDLVQELNISVFLACRDYKENYNVKLSTLVVTYIKKCLLNLYNKGKSQKRNGMVVYDLENIVCQSYDKSFEELECYALLKNKDHIFFYEAVKSGFSRYKIIEMMGKNKYDEVSKDLIEIFSV